MSEYARLKSVRDAHIAKLDAVNTDSIPHEERKRLEDMIDKEQKVSVDNMQKDSVDVLEQLARISDKKILALRETEESVPAEVKNEIENTVLELEQATNVIKRAVEIEDKTKVMLTELRNDVNISSRMKNLDLMRNNMAEYLLLIGQDAPTKTQSHLLEQYQFHVEQTVDILEKKKTTGGLIGEEASFYSALKVGHYAVDNLLKQKEDYIHNFVAEADETAVGDAYKYQDSADDDSGKLLIDKRSPVLSKSKNSIPVMTISQAIASLDRIENKLDRIIEMLDNVIENNKEFKNNKTIKNSITP